MRVRFMVVIDRESVDSRMNANGGDYDFGRTVAIQDGQPVAVRFWASSDFQYCPHEGRFGECEPGCISTTLPASAAEGWETGQPLATELLGVATERLRVGEFSPIAHHPELVGVELNRHLGKYS